MSRAAARARSMLSLGGQHRRYLDVEDVRDLQEVADPATTTDETATSWRDWAGENTSLVIALSIFTVLLSGIVIWQASRFLPSIVSNPYVQSLTAASILLFAGAKFGSKRKSETIEEQERLTLRKNNSSVTFLGSYVDATAGEGGYFIPIKGFRRRGQKPSPYTVADLSAGFADLLNKNLDVDDPAVIHLHPKYTTEEKTEHGTYVHVRTDELEPATESPVAVLKTTIPEFREEDINEIADEARAQRQKATKHRQEAERWHAAYRDLLEQVNAPVDERVTDRIQEHAQLGLAVRGDRRALQSSGDGDGDGGGNRDFRGADLSGFTLSPTAGGTSSNGVTNQDAIDEVEAQLETDDDDE